MRSQQRNNMLYEYKNGVPEPWVGLKPNIEMELKQRCPMTHFYRAGSRQSRPSAVRFVALHLNL